MKRKKWPKNNWLCETAISNGHDKHKVRSLLGWCNEVGLNFTD